MKVVLQLSIVFLVIALIMAIVAIITKLLFPVLTLIEVTIISINIFLLVLTFYKPFAIQVISAFKAALGKHLY